MRRELKKQRENAAVAKEEEEEKGGGKSSRSIFSTKKKGSRSSPRASKIRGKERQGEEGQVARVGKQK